MPTASSPRRALAQLLVGNQIQQAIHVAARLGIADLLADGPRTVDALADATGAQPAALRRLLRALASLGIFAEDEGDRFALTPLAALLRRGTADSMRAFALWSGGVRYRAFGELEWTVRSGRPAFERVAGTEFYAYLDGDPEAAAIFDEMMTVHTAPVAADVAALDFGAARTVVDVGGGRGELLAAILARHRSLRGVLVDSARVGAGAREALAAAGVLDRCAIVTGDAFDTLPPGDVYVLKSVVHGMDDEHAAAVLRNCRAAGGDSARVLVVELVLGRNGDNSGPGPLMDLLMLIGCYGRERTEAEFRTLLERAGLRLQRVTPARHGYAVLDAVS